MERLAIRPFRLRPLLILAALAVGALLVAPGAWAQCIAANCTPPGQGGGMTCTGTLPPPAGCPGCTIGMTAGFLPGQMGVTSCTYSGMPVSMVMAMHTAGATPSPACGVVRSTQCGFLTPSFSFCFPTLTYQATCQLDNLTPGGGLPVELMEFSVEDGDESGEAEPEPDAGG